MNTTDTIQLHLDLTIPAELVYPLLAFAEQSKFKFTPDQTPAPGPNPWRKKLTEEEKRERNKARCRVYNDAHREEINARMRYIMDKRNHAHIPGYVPTSNYHRAFHIQDLTDDGFLYLAHEPKTNAFKIGMSRCNLDTRLANYAKESGSITFLQRSPLLEDIDEAEALAHAMLRGHVTHVRTDDKCTPSFNVLAEWFTLRGDFTLEDVKRVFDEVVEQYAKDAENV